MGAIGEQSGVQAWAQARLGWTALLRSQTANTGAGQQGDSYPAFEIICCECGDDPSLDYCRAPPMLQRLRGPYWLAPGAEAYENHLAWHEKHQPAISAEQVLSHVLGVCAGKQLLVHGVGGVTGGLLVALAALRGAQVIATASPASQQPVTALGARHVIDYRDQDWPAQVRAITGNRGVDAAANAVPGGAASAIDAVADGGRLTTITSDPPSQRRGITVSSIYVRPDGNQLRELATRCADGRLEIPVAASYRLADAARALAQVVGRHASGAVLPTP